MIFREVLAMYSSREPDRLNDLLKVSLSGANRKLILPNHVPHLIDRLRVHAATSFSAFADSNIIQKFSDNLININIY